MANFLFEIMFFLFFYWNSVFYRKTTRASSFVKTSLRLNNFRRRCKISANYKGYFFPRARTI